MKACHSVCQEAGRNLLDACVHSSRSVVKSMPSPSRNPRPLAPSLLAAGVHRERHRAVGRWSPTTDAGGLPLRPPGPLAFSEGVKSRRRDQRLSRPRRLSFGEQNPSAPSFAIENNSTTIGIAAFVGSLWIGASFGGRWTRLLPHYQVECRGGSSRSASLRGSASVLSSSPPASSSGDREWLDRQHRPTPVGLSKSGDRHVCCSPPPAGDLPDLRGIFWGAKGAQCPWGAVWPGALFVNPRRRPRQLAVPITFDISASPTSAYGRLHPHRLLWFYVLSLALMPAR